MFAYVVTRTKFGDHYWALAHVTPSKDATGAIVGYHSNRRVPDKRIVTENIIPFYQSLLTEEQKHQDRKDGLQAGYSMVGAMLADRGLAYDEFIAAL